MAKDELSKYNPDGTSLGQDESDLIAFHGSVPVVQSSGAAQAAAPAGGTGATAGAYNSAVNRDAMIDLVNEMRLTLVNLGLMKGSA